MVVGVDFDNTLINYDDVFFCRAVDLGLVKDVPILQKRQVRDQLRLLPDGETWWQRLQAYVYTKGMAQARLIKGVNDFFAACQQKGIQTYIISHKTEYSEFDQDRLSLRQAALGWMKTNGFFDPTGLGLSTTQVYFESTRAAKIERIKFLRCTHFIDDLEEVFLEKIFPAGVDRILYAPQEVSSLPSDIKVFNSWEKIHGHIFRA